MVIKYLKIKLDTGHFLPAKDAETVAFATGTKRNENRRHSSCVGENMNEQMKDRELLELAAKAAGMLKDGVYYGSPEWNPLTNDGDALRLSINLGISIIPYPIYSNEKHSVKVKQRRKEDMFRENNPTETAEVYGNDPYAATRRAIVRAAAEIGKTI